MQGETTPTYPPLGRAVMRHPGVNTGGQKESGAQDHRAPENCHRAHAQRPSLQGPTGTGDLRTLSSALASILQDRCLPCCSLPSTQVLSQLQSPELQGQARRPRIDGWPSPEASMVSQPWLEADRLCRSLHLWSSLWLLFGTNLSQNIFSLDLQTLVIEADRHVESPVTQTVT